MRVRTAGLDDLPLLIQVEEECFGAEKFSANTLKALVVRKDAFALLAEQGGEVAGAALCLCSGARAIGRIASVAVMVRRRRKGVATLLLEEAETELKRRGARTLGLEVGVGNRPAISLYLKHGYALSAIIRDYYGPGRHAFYMEKVLPSKGGKKVVLKPA